MPVLGKLEGATTPNESAIARVNGIREETGGSHRLFLPVVSGPILIYDKKTKAFTTYLDFNGYGENRGLFKKFFTISGYGNGINGFNLDPDYAKNGKFYTTHMEDPSIEAPGGPQNTMFPGLQTSGYTTTAPITTPGPVMHQGVLIEWTDTNPSNNTFEGTAREIFRVWLNTRSHQLGEVIFNPTARRGDPDWRVLYVDVGDGASGESKNVADSAEPAAARHDGRQDRAHHSRSERAHEDEHGERERPLSHSERQPVREDAGRAQGDLGLRPAQSAQADVCGRSRRTPRTTGWSPASAA